MRAFAILTAMTVDSSDFKTPSQLLSALLKDRGWTGITLGLVLGLDKSSANRLVSGTRPIDAEMALTLEELFGVPAERFLELQRNYDLAEARISVRADPKRSMRAHIFGRLPISEMIKRGWLVADDARDPAVSSELIRFFGVNRIDDIEILPHAAKKTQVNIDITPAQLAWLYRVKQIAAEMLVARYSPDSLQAAVGKLSNLLSAAEEARKAPRILSEAGVRFVIVESLPSAKIDGVCFWLDDRSPVIGMTMRFDRIDNFWFVLRHEIEHVLKGHGKTAAVFDAELEGDRAGVGEAVSDDERVANEAASNFCVPKSKMDAFIARKAPFFYEHDILGFAKTIGVHPGLVAGQLRYRTGLYKRFLNHIVKVRDIVVPNAIVDGWGNVAPTD
jgi:HTH-type transcriptional regulator / antitoxin HigA